MATRFHPGDLLLYKKQKHGSQPSPRAHSIAAAVQSGSFSYVIDKLWIVADIRDDGMLEVCTRRGKRIQLTIDDPNLRRLNWWSRLWYRNEYQKLAQVAAQK